MKTMRFILCLLPAIILAGCSSDDGGGMPERVAVQFSAGDIAGLQSRTTAGGTQWTAGDRIGIFMVKEGQTLSAANIAEDADNVPYKAQAGDNAQSGFTPAGNTIYYPQNGSKVDFIAYYPYKQTGTNPGEITDYTYRMDVSDQTKPEDIDVLYSNNATGYGKNSGPVDLLFKHALSKVSFALTSGEGSPDLAGAKIEISNVATTAAIDLADGTVTATNSGQTVTANTAADGLSSSAIVVPQTLSGTKLIITLADNVSVFEWTFTTAEFKEGKNHPYNITVDKTGITVTTGEITDWTGTGDNPITGGAGGWKVGDYYPDPKVTFSSPGVVSSGTMPVGVVFWVDPADSRHGKVVGFQEKSSVAWADNANWQILTNVNNMTDGLVNMGLMAQYINDNGKLWSNYPAFEWVHTTMNGGTATYAPGQTGVWYLPAKEELQHLYCAWNGVTPQTWYSGTPGWVANNAARANFNDKLTAAGDEGLATYYYWSSSEYDSYSAWFVDFYNGLTYFLNKVTGANLNRARCVLAF